jgi:hypothetical protein
MPILDNSIRWNSIYKLLTRAIKLKDRIFLFYREYHNDLQADYLSEDDWNHLKAILEGLELFYQATTRVEGKASAGYHDAIWEALPLLKVLLSVTEDGRQRESDKGCQSLAITYQNTWEKIQKYYNKTNKAHSIYVAVVLLYPSYRK